LANHLKMALVNSILTLKQKGWSARRIGRELGVHREAVARHIRLAEASKPASEVPTGNSVSKPANEVPAGNLASKPASEVPAGNLASKPASEVPAGNLACGGLGVASPVEFDRPDSAGPQASELPPCCPNSAACPRSRAWVEPGADGLDCSAEAEPATEVPDGEVPIGPVPAGTVGGSKPATQVPTGNSVSKPANEVPAGTARSACEPYRAVIEAMVRQGLSAQRIYQDLIREHAFAHAYDSVKRYVRVLRAAEPVAFRRMESGPGAEAQVDFGTGAPVVDTVTGRKRRPHVFRFVLSFSRKGYTQAVYQQRTEDFLQCLENAFWHIGGVPATIVIDNFKAAVSHPDWYDPQLHPRLLAFCEHYGTVILPTRPRTPRHKGKVENGVKYSQNNALKGRQFESLQQQNLFLQDWEANVADVRIHGTTRRQVRLVFEEQERSALGPLPAGRFPFFHEERRSVQRDGHVEVDKAHYSVPPEYLGLRLWVRWDGRVVRIFNPRMELIVTHAQREPGRTSTLAAHIVDKKISSVERGTEWLLRKVSVIGDHSRAWAEAMLTERGIAGVRVLVGLRSLASRYTTDQIEQACETALSHRAFHLRDVRNLIKRGGGPKQMELDFLQEHNIIREMSHYGDIVRAAIRRDFQPVDMEPASH